MGGGSGTKMCVHRSARALARPRPNKQASVCISPDSLDLHVCVSHACTACTHTEHRCHSPHTSTPRLPHTTFQTRPSPLITARMRNDPTAYLMSGEGLGTGLAICNVLVNFTRIHNGSIWREREGRLENSLTLEQQLYSIHTMLIEYYVLDQVMYEGH